MSRKKKRKIWGDSFKCSQEQLSKYCRELLMCSAPKSGKSSQRHRCACNGFVRTPCDSMVEQTSSGFPSAPLRTGSPLRPPSYVGRPPVGMTGGSEFPTHQPRAGVARFGVVAAECRGISMSTRESGFSQTADPGRTFAPGAGGARTASHSGCGCRHADAAPASAA